MSSLYSTRRDVLRGAGALGLAATVPTVSAAEEEWTIEETPTDGDLYDVVYTDEGAYAVGQGGVILERTDTDEGWRKVTDGGASGDGRDLYGADVTDDGERLWFAGASGVIGEYDPATGNIEDRGEPQDNTENFLDVAATGEAGEANVYVADEAGAVNYSLDNGRSGTWNSASVGQGDALTAIDFHGERSGHVVNANGSAFETDDGTTYGRIGVEDTTNAFYGIDSDGPEDLWVTAGGGTVYRYDGAWRRYDLGDPTLRDVAIEDAQGPPSARAAACSSTQPTDGARTPRRPASTSARSHWARRRLPSVTHTAGCNYVKRSRPEDGALNSIQPDIAEES